jgi:hypothetical protein
MLSDRPSLYWWAIAVASAGCGVSVAPIEVAPGCPEQPLRGPAQYEGEAERNLIDDFEHEDPLLPRRAGRDGTWVLGSDGSAEDLEANPSDRCAARGQHAGHFAGRGFSSWGANWTAVLRSAAGGLAVPYDAASYRGISFWAAVGADVPVPFSLPVGVTTMDVAWNGGICGPCMDYYRTTVSLGHAWQRFEFRFSELTQSGSGDPLIELRRDQLVGMIVWPEGDFDLWLDDVRFEP